MKITADCKHCGKAKVAGLRIVKEVNGVGLTGFCIVCPDNKCVGSLKPSFLKRQNHHWVVMSDEELKI